MDLAVAGLTFAISRRAAELGASAGALGLLGSVWFAPYVLVALVSGRLSDRYGRRRIALIAPFVTIAMTLACAATTNVPLLIGWTAIFGVGLGFFWPPVMAWISDGAHGAALHTRLTRFGVAWNIGLLTGFALTGMVFQRWPAMAFGIPAVSIGVILVLLLLPARATDTSPDDKALPRVPSGRGFRKTAWLANFGAQLATFGAVALFPQLATHLNVRADAHGALLAVGRGAALLMIVALELAMFWRVRLWPLWVAQLVGVGAAAMVGVVSGTWWFFVAFALMGAVTGYSYQASIFFTLDEMSEKGKGTGLHEAFLAAGMLSGPLLAGWVGNLFGLRAPYFFCAAALACSVAAQVAMTGKLRFFGKKF